MKKHCVGRYKGLVIFMGSGGGVENGRRGGTSDVLPLQQEGVEKSFSHTKGGAHKVLR